MKSGDIIRLQDTRKFEPIFLEEGIAKITLDVLPQYLLELLNMGVCLYFAENATKKPKEIEFETADISRWSETGDLLEQLFSFLTRDYVKVSFKSIKKGRSSQERIMRGRQYDYAISLFSGGVDSYCGTHYLLDDKRRPYLVHTSTSNKMQGITKKVFLDSFKDKVPGMHSVRAQFRAWCVNARYPQLRSALFLFNAAPLMELLDGNEIWIPENGMMMINPPVSNLVVYTRATRPEVLLLMQRILSSYFDRKICILSPFCNMTKAEVAAKYLDRESFKSTYSCFNYRWGRTDKMCGECYGCNVTRLSLWALGVNPEDRFKQNPLIVQRMPSDERRGGTIRHFADFVDMCGNLILDKEVLNLETYKTIESAEIAYKDLGYQIDVWNLMKRFAGDMLLGFYDMFDSLDITMESTIIGKKLSKILARDEVENIIETRRSVLRS